MKRLLFVILLCVTVLGLKAELVSIGNGTELHQGLPIEPVANFSYSQQLFMASEIGVGGIIDTLYFQYNVSSTVFFEGNKALSISLGHSSRTQMSSWVPVDSLYPVFNGVLSQTNFLSGLPGTGWLQISLSQPFLYDGISNLVLAVDENSIDNGSTSDDFYCTNTGSQRVIQFQHMTTNPDPSNPPATGYTLKTHRSNLRISIQAQHYYPIQPTPTDGASSISIHTGFTWISLCNLFSLELGTHPDSLVLIANNIPGAMWQLEGQLLQNRQYYWRVTGYYNSMPYPSPLWSFTTAGEPISAPQNLSGFWNGVEVQLSWQPPAIGTATNYNVFRNSAFYFNTTLSHCSDANVTSGFTYYYHVSAINATGSESPVSNLISVSVPNIQPDLVIDQGFETCQSFSSTIPDWQTLDLDAAPTWAWDNVSFPHEGEALSWISFAPAETTPALTGFPPYSGNKMLMAMSSMTPPNNDWLISPGILLGNNSSLSFQARSAVADYGLERLRVLISTTSPVPASFTVLHPGAYLAVPAQWTAYNYDLSAYSGQHIYLAWNCVSVDAFAFFLDDIRLISTGAQVTNVDDYIPAPAFISYPNPARNSFAIMNKSGEPFSLELFDLKGRTLYTGKELSDFNSACLPISLSSGIYFIRIHQNGSSRVLKQVLAK